MGGLAPHASAGYPPIASWEEEWTEKQSRAGGSAGHPTPTPHASIWPGKGAGVSCGSCSWGGILVVSLQGLEMTGCVGKSPGRGASPQTTQLHPTWKPVPRKHWSSGSVGQGNKTCDCAPLQLSSPHPPTITSQPQTLEVKAF